MCTAPRPHARSAGLAVGVVTLLVVASACGSSNPSRPTEPCSYTLSASSQSFAVQGGAGSVAVSTGASCAWTVEGASGWVTLGSPASTTGPAVVSFSVTPNAEQAAREKVLTIAARGFTVRQDGAAPCAYTIDPDRRELGRNGGTATVAVSAGAGCAWTAASAVPWITISGARDGRGGGSVTYSVAENDATSTRTGTLTIAGRTHTVEQQGEASSAQCEYRVTPVAFEPCMPAGTLAAVITTGASCTWTATSDAGWLSVTSGRSGKGPGTIAIAYTSNYLAPRRGVVMVRWPTPSLGQNLHVEQAGCRYGVSRDTVDVPSAGGGISFDVLQESEPNTCGGPLQNACVWTARSDAAWVTVATSMPRIGDDRVSLTVAPNTGAARTAHVTVGDGTVTISQPAP